MGNLIAFERLFTDNKNYRSFNGLLFTDSLAQMVWKYLYSVGNAPKTSPGFTSGKEIPLYDFMTLSVYFIQASRSPLAEADIQEILKNLRQGSQFSAIKEFTIEYRKDSLIVTYASNKLILSLFFVAYVYACALSVADKDWKDTAIMLRSQAKKELPDKTQKLVKHPLFQFSKEAIKMLIDDIKKNYATSDVAQEEQNSQTDSSENLKQLQETIIQQQKQISQLEQELSKAKNECDNYKKNNKGFTCGEYACLLYAAARKIEGKDPIKTRAKELFSRITGHSIGRYDKKLMGAFSEDDKRNVASILEKNMPKWAELVRKL